MQAKDKRIRDDDPLMERYRHAELEVKQAVSEGRISREEAGRKLREIKGKLWGDEREKEDPNHEIAKLSAGSRSDRDGRDFSRGGSQEIERVS